MQYSFKILILTLLLGALVQETTSYACKQYLYNYSLLVFDWPAEYCYHHQNCKQNWKQLFPQNQLILRGYWPASIDIDFLNCIQYMGHDPNCNVAYNFDESSFSQTLKTDLVNYWPQITVSNDRKSEQWSEHGTCYLSVVQTLNSSTIGNQKNIFNSYFTDSVKKAKDLKLNVNQTQFKTKGDLATNLGIKQNQFYALCEYDTDYLSQIRVCYDIKGVAGSQSLISCLAQQPNECQFPIKVRTKSEYYVKGFFVLVLLIFVLLQ